MKTIFQFFTINVLLICVSGQCNIPPAPPGQAVDKSWLEKVLRDGMIIPLQSRLDEQVPINPPPRDENYTKYKNKLCFDLTLQIKTGLALAKVEKTPVTSYYETELGNNHFTILEPKNGTTLYDTFRYFFESSIAKTDNNSYILWVGCINYQKMGFLVMTTPAPLDNTLKQELVDTAATFGVNPYDVSDGTDAYVFQRAQKTDCDAGASNFIAGFARTFGFGRKQ